MPKAIVTAEEVLAQTGGPSEVAESEQVQATEPPTAPPPPPGPPPAGFEDPPTEAPSAADVLAPPEAPTPVVEPPLATIPEAPADPEPEVSEPAESPVPPPPAVPSWSFVKNVHPGEKMFLRGGKELVFPGQLFTTVDAALAKKILEVADQYHIVLR